MLSLFFHFRSMLFFHMNIKNIFFATTLYTLIGKVLLLVQGVIIARVLTVSDFGLYSYLMSIMNLIGIPVMAGLHPYILKVLSDSIKNNNHKEINTILNSTFLYITLMSIAIITISKVLSEFYDSEYYSNIIIISFIIYIRALQNRINSVMYSFSSPLFAIVPQLIITPAIVVCATILANCFYSLSYIEVLHYILLGLTVSLCFSLVKTNSLMKSASIRRKIKISKFKISEISPYILFYAITMSNNEILVLLVESLFSSQEVAYYKVAFSSAVLLTITTQIINSFLANIITSTSNKIDLQKKITIISRFNSVFVTLIFMMLFIFSKPIISFVYGKQYEPMVDVFEVLLIGFWLSSLYCSVSMLLNMNGGVKYASKSFFISLVTIIVSSLILVPFFELLGIAISQAVGLLVSSISMNHYLKVTYGINSLPILNKRLV
ncbi:oligosaccharide flippase family protein [Vibrio rotiferianus]|uniref:oligosaccharide flippase family protein n=1 Tax=Vibrio rotiferianus TaxID=190895 RepID=UPI00390B7176